ncbi:outer membrane lipoprotein carrier protein LolA [Hoeflea prorocentri]|uniref:Outer membrane lipoprotein carrier protein LolA n=1 Tax=Hoeflea prorocentri TaxID=1922333 RepID=A0A9X3ZJC0_9HYPH|nr:outer membrane lipoprotein carrier protein LolA [Hoeflea prorocentri]MCY6383294.1 outer membrane lipoprotein carrier protein LolA [Hoeflea prorocentri]MDA5401094.1 outer membrane lipoprotein carrier protein LolA [Hoeflea prorocentri]
MNQTDSPVPTRKTSRRFVLRAMGLAAAAVLLSVGAPQAHAQDQAAQRIADHFSAVKTMTGEFVQFSPSGKQIGGKFFIERPGKLRFNYEAPSPVRVIADGKSVVIGNRKLQTWDIYPLSKTPLKLLLSERINLKGDTVKSVKVEPDLTTIVLGNKSIFGDSTITMMFDTKSNELRQWTITDAQGKATSVMIFNVRTDVKFADNVFEIPYYQVHRNRGNDR